MNRRHLILFFLIEIFAIVWAGTMFSVLSSKLVAGALAGSYFVISGLIMLAIANKWPRKWTSLTWYMLFVHVFGVSLPMLVSRFLQTQSNFEDVRILGIPGPVYHNISSVVFSLLMGATVVDFLRCWWAERNAQPTGGLT